MLRAFVVARVGIRSACETLEHRSDLPTTGDSQRRAVDAAPRLLLVLDHSAVLGVHHLLRAPLDLAAGSLKHRSRVRVA